MKRFNKLANPAKVTYKDLNEAAASLEVGIVVEFYKPTSGKVVYDFRDCYGLICSIQGAKKAMLWLEGVRTGVAMKELWLDAREDCITKEGP